MTGYRPKYAGTVTKYVFVEDPDMTPSDLAIRAYELGEGAMIKETCFGLMITGKEEDVERIVCRLRELDPNHIFVKDRGFPPGDPRRCRADLGGARPGFHGHEFETKILSHIVHGLQELPNREEGAEPSPPHPSLRKKLDVDKLKKIIDREMP
jgi:putative methanogenesis marker protein 6